MQFDTHVVFSLMAGAGAAIGWIRIKKTDPAYLPFTLLLTIGFINELISYFVLKKHYTNAPYINLFALAEALLVTQLLYRLGLFKKKRQPLFLQCIFVIAWLCECLYYRNLTSFYSYFIAGYSTILVFLLIDLLHEVMFKTASQLYRNPVFLICMGMIVYFTYTIIVELFWFYGFNNTEDFRERIYEVFTYINLFTNILFILATLWIPLKRKYILRSSSGA